MLDLIKGNSKTDRNFAAQLMRYLFTDDERLKEKTTISGYNNSQQLEPTMIRVNYIYDMVQLYFRVDEHKIEERKVKLRKAMDEANRHDRALLKV